MLGIDGIYIRNEALSIAFPLERTLDSTLEPTLASRSLRRLSMSRMRSDGQRCC